MHVTDGGMHVLYCLLCLKADTGDVKSPVNSQDFLHRTSSAGSFDHMLDSQHR